MKDSSDHKEQMLARIRVALGRTAGASMPEPLAPFPSQTAALDVESLIRKFSDELEKVGGRVARPDSVDEIKNYLEGLLSSGAHATVAVSDARAINEMGISAWFADRGLRVVPSLNQFMSGKIEDSKRFSSPGSPDLEDVSLLENYKSLLAEASIGVTCADYALADTGTLVLMSGEEQHRLISLMPPIHVCLLNPDLLVAGLTELLAHLHDEFCSSEPPPLMMTCITGPSRTADIEQTITIGIHGPQALHVLLYSPAASS
jgi:L-lactate dehydrogenase complex protein LldG